jgi:two-component system, NarL family, sensor histidine kinase DesK
MAEVEGISRQALSDIRNTIMAIPIDTLAAELERAALTLRTAGVTLVCQCEYSATDSEQERILCLALREAVTNIVRHANARNCRVRVHSNGDVHILEVQDDGRGGPTPEGEGLRGMRERAEACGGSVSRDMSAGTRLTLRLPMARVRM